MDILEALRGSNNILENVVDQNVVIDDENVVIGAENVFVNDQNIDNLIEKDLLEDKDDKKRTFYQILYSNKDFQKRLVANKSIMRRKKEHFELIEEIKSSYNKLPKNINRREKYLFNQYAILNVEEDKMINKDHINEAKPLVYTFLENLYFDIKREHEQVGHGGRDKTHKQCKQVYSNVTVEVINIWLQTCVECILRTRKNTISGLVEKPVRSHDILSRGQVDLINCEAYADGEFKYIMNYRDHFTKFIHLYPLKTKTAAEVAWHLLEIFLTFGAPVILQSDNGKEFVASIITELKQL
jgi:hypothetical protein